MTRTPPPMVVEGEVIAGKYRVEQVLGSGGMGVVVAARHLQLDQRVALKFLHREAGTSRAAAGRFLREGQALARLTSPHVARVMDVCTLENGEPYLVMEFLDGLDLDAVLEQRGPLPIGEAVGHLLQACEAIAEAHANGIVHRDLKPSNLFLVRSAEGLPLVKVLDFGISKTEGAEPGTQDTTTGALVGSPRYMSPEQIRNARNVDQRCDIWALGVILHELIAGQPPFRGESMAGTLAAIAADPPPPIRSLRAEVPVELELVILRCLEKKPERRYASVAELARALLEFAPEEAQGAASRIDRLLRATPRPQSLDGHAETTSERATSATVPAWEGHTATEVSRTSLSTRRMAALAVAGLLFVGSAFLLFSRRSEQTSPVPIAKTTASVQQQVPTHAMPMPAPSVSHPPPLASSASRSPAVAGTSKNKMPARRAGPPTIESENDGTADRK